MKQVRWVLRIYNVRRTHGTPYRYFLNFEKVNEVDSERAAAWEKLTE